MAKSEHKRQQKLLKKQRRTNDLKKARNIKLNISNRELILEAQRSPWLGCFITGESGMHSVFAIRQTRNGTSACVFLVDMYCLGIKDAFFIKDFDMDAFRERQEQFGNNKVTPAHALKLISDAIAYARSIGFEPHSQSSICQLIFGDTDVSECTETFVFGKNGKPLFTSGPHDSRQRCYEILHTLEKLGEGNYHFLMLAGEASSSADSDLDSEDDFEDDLDDDLDSSEPSLDEARTIDADSVRNIP